MRWVQWLAYVVALLLRLWTAAHYSAPLQERVELSSPLTSFKRLQEGLFLEAQKPGSAYAGWAFHQPPVVLGIFQQLHSLPPYVYHLIWLLADALAALLLFSIVRHVLRDEATRTHSVEPQRVTADVVSVVPHVAAICYLLHPYSWLSSAALSLTMIENVFVLGSLHFALQDNRVLAPLCVAIAAYTSLYPVMLVPAVLMTLKPGNRLNGALIFAFFAYALGLASYLVVGPGDWRWLRAVYLYVLKVEDLTPNIGLFWYYFLETFTHYRNFFLVALQLHTFSYVIPCTLRLREQPVLLFWVLLSVITLFKPYPVAGDVLLQLSLLPVFYHLLFYMKANFILLNIHIITSLLFPVLWYMWVESGSGNANFVYSITLVHAIADGWLVAEVVSCGLSWRYTDKHRVPMVPKKQATSSSGEVKKEKTQ